MKRCQMLLSSNSRRYDGLCETVRKNPDLIVLGTNELKTNKTAHNIALDIIKLGLELKSEENDVMINSIVCRNDALNDKGKNVNNIL